MADTTTAAPEQVSDDSRRDEWARLDAEEGGHPTPDPADKADSEPADQGGTGQASSPPAGPAAEQPAGSDTAAADDPWKNAPPELRQEYDKAINQVRTQTGRLQATTRQLAELSAETQSLREKVKPKAEEETGPVLAEEQRQALRDEFPDVAVPLLDVIGGLERQVQALSAQDASREQQAEATRQLEIQRFLAAEEQRLGEQHPDWSKQVARPEFTAWANAQPRMVREAIVRNGNGIVDADEAILIINNFKQANGGSNDNVAARRSAQLAGTRLPVGRTSTPTPSTTLDKESEWKRLDALDRQKSGARSTR